MTNPDQLNRRSGDVANLVVNMLSLGGSLLSNLISQLFYGSNYNPATQATVGVIGNLVGSSLLGSALGADNPLVTQHAIRSLSNYYSGPIQGHYLQNMIMFGRALSNYNQYNTEVNARSPFQLTQTESSALAYHMRGFFSSEDWKNLALSDTNEERSNQNITRIMDKASAVVSTAKKVLNMGDNLAEILNTANAFGGTNDVEANFNRFLRKNAEMINAGLDIDERQSVIKSGIQMNMAYRQRGFSATSAAMIADKATSAMITATNLSREGVNIDINRSANLAAEKAAIFLDAQSNELQLALVAGGVLDGDRRNEFRRQLKEAGNDPSKIHSVVSNFGLMKEMNAMRIRYANDPHAKTRVLSGEDQDVLDAALINSQLNETSTSVDNMLSLLDSKSAEQARALFNDVKLGKKTKLSKEEADTLDRAGILGATNSYLSLLKNRDKKNSIQTLAQAIGTESADLLMGSDAISMLDTIRRLGRWDEDSKTYINDKLKYLDEDVAKRAFLESDKVREGAKYDESKSLERWNVFLAESQKAQGMSLALDSGDTLFRDKDGKFYSADKNEVSKASMPAYVREIWTQFQTFVGQFINDDAVNVNIRGEKEIPPDSSTHLK